MQSDSTQVGAASGVAPRGPMTAALYERFLWSILEVKRRKEAASQAREGRASDTRVLTGPGGV